MANHFVGGITMVTEECLTCGMSFAMTEDFRSKRLKDHKNFYCPSGHTQYFSADSAEDKLRRENQRLLQGRAQLQDVISDKNKEINYQKNKVRAEKGAKTKIKRRIAHGNCPNCKRSFSNLERHMKSQHPEEVTNVS